jgi:hypothetical protein
VRRVSRYPARQCSSIDRQRNSQSSASPSYCNERLGASDGGLILMRQMMREALAAVERGEDPPCIIRDPARQRVVFSQKSSMMKEKTPDANYALGYAKATERGRAHAPEA